MCITALLTLLGLGGAGAYAQGAVHDHPATGPAAAEFKGDPYLLTTDPVSGATLPENPVLYQNQGRELRFTDQKSLEQFKANPAQYLAGVDQKMTAQQTPFYPLEVCVISGDKLGGDMGQPVNLIYKNRLVRFCCPDCVKEFQKDPAAAIAKLDQAVIAKQGANYPLTTCVVSGEKLGGEMGAPAALVVGNRLVRFCCSGCIPDFKKNPAKYLKLLDAAAAKPTDAKTKP
jgi:YHS domain-containing protein